MFVANCCCLLLSLATSAWSLQLVVVTGMPERDDVAEIIGLDSKRQSRGCSLEMGRSQWLLSLQGERTGGAGGREKEER